MKALSIWQPWASLIVLGYKKIETRSWSTNYRGQIVIHAAKRKPKKVEIDFLAQAPELAFLHDYDLFLGRALAICELTDCQLMTDELIEQQGELELHCGDWQPRRYAWQLQLIKAIDSPIPVQGKQGLWEFYGINF